MPPVLGDNSQRGAQFRKVPASQHQKPRWAMASENAGSNIERSRDGLAHLALEAAEPKAAMVFAAADRATARRRIQERLACERQTLLYGAQLCYFRLQMFDFTIDELAPAVRARQEILAAGPELCYESSFRKQAEHKEARQCRHLMPLAGLIYRTVTIVLARCNARHR